MNGEAIFKFKCGAASQATRVADWLECENWPDDLRSLMEMSFGSFESVASLVFLASAKGRQVLVEATGPSSPQMVVAVLDYVIQSWRSVPSRQGFVFG